MPRPSAGNAGISSKIDASGSSSVGDIYMWFLGGASGKAAADAQKKKEPAILRVAGLSAETPASEVKAYFAKYYNNVKEATLSGGGRATVLFGTHHGERDKALLELNHTEIGGHRITLSKPPVASLQQKTASRKRRADGSLTDESIHSILLEREQARRKKDYHAADACVAELKQYDVLIDQRAGVWRAADGRTGALPTKLTPTSEGAHMSYGGGGAPVPTNDPTRQAYARLSGDDSLGTHTLKRILTPFSVDDIAMTRTRDGYALITFMDSHACSTALSLAHYGPTGKKIQLLTPQAYSELMGGGAAAAAASSSSYAASPALPDGWAVGWSQEYSRYYYTHAGSNTTQWEPPPSTTTQPMQQAGGGVVKGLVDYEDSDEEEAEAAPAAAAASSTPAPVSASADPNWFYGDPTGQVHGPYPQRMMITWVQGGYLHGETPVYCEGGGYYIEGYGVMGEGFGELKERKVLAEHLPASTTASLYYTGATAQVDNTRMIQEAMKRVRQARHEAELHVAARPAAALPPPAAAAAPKGKAKKATPPPPPEPQPAAEPEPTPAAPEPPAAVPSLTAEDAKAMKVTELKEELETRGLDLSGKKADLLKRLLANL